jgi:hypothetical protein
MRRWRKVLAMGGRKSLDAKGADDYERAVRARVEETCKAQGVPVKVRDATALARAAVLLDPAPASAGVEASRRRGRGEVPAAVLRSAG